MFYSRYRHLGDGSRQQNKGYRDGALSVNRHRMVYGLVYG